MKGRKSILAAVLVLIGLPVGLVVVEAVSFQVRNRNSGVIVSSGQEREYLIYVPESYDRTRPTPLVISLHGGAMWPAAQKETSQWNRVADENGFIVVYPAGSGFTRHKAWRVDPGPGLAKEVLFISELIDTLKADYNIDPARVYANGLSNGAGMSFVLSCTLSDRIAAVGMVAAAHLTPWSWCTDRRPVPMIAFHGTADRQAPFEGGTSWIVPNPLPDIRTWTANWAGRNGCGAKAVESVVAADVTRLEYTDCADDAAVVLYTVLGGGHTWPGGGPLPEWFVGPVTRSIDASSEMWAFFREHRLPRDSGTTRPKLVGGMRFLDGPASGREARALLSTLPDLTQTMTIDGYSQPGSSPNTHAFGSGLNTVLRIAIDGSATSSEALTIVAPDVVIRGLAIRHQHREPRRDDSQQPDRYRHQDLERGILLLAGFLALIGLRRIES